MGQASKFSFPTPGRGRHTATTKEKNRPPARSPVSNTSSKAQRLLGTEGDLNIDNPKRGDEDVSWMYPSSRSSDRTISVSDSAHSTQSTNDTHSFNETSSEQGDHDSGVFPNSRMPAKASSTILGQTYVEDAGTDTSSASRRMRREDSSSTLKSYYDRQKSPLAISQQTSASSARDLALRKGYPTVIQHQHKSLLLQVEALNGLEDQHGDGLHDGGDKSRDKSMRKKPARLDLSMLFPSRSKRNGKVTEGEALTSSIIPSSASSTGSQTTLGRRKLSKSQSKESLRSQQYSIRSTKSHDPRPQQHHRDTLSALYDAYEQSALSSPMSRIPESSVPETESIPRIDRHAENQRRELSKDPRTPPSSSYSAYSLKSRVPQNLPAKESPARRNYDSYALPKQLLQRDQESSFSAEKEAFSWKHVRENMTSPPWDSSAASVSSRNTKTSRRTSTSAFSKSDLKQDSVLSLSSDSEETTSDQESIRSPADPSNSKAMRILTGASRLPDEARRQASHPSENKLTKKHSSRKGATLAGPFLTIPETSATSSRLSGPWSPPKLDDSLIVTPTTAEGGEKISNRTPSSASKRSSTRRTPPLSPTLAVSRSSETASSRFMAVSKQEEALLEALRRKRAGMREKTIEEHEIQKTPPQAPDKKLSRLSEASSVGTVRGHEILIDKQDILHDLDMPLNDGHSAESEEPSPDPSDSLSVGSDEESILRTSGAAPSHKIQLGPNFGAMSENPRPRMSPTTPPSVARLSAVGSSIGLRSERASYASLGVRKRDAQASVRFLDDAKLEDGEDGAIWGL